MRLLAIDQGTTSTRGLIVDADKPARICAAFKHAQHRPRSGWVEHDPSELLANIHKVLQQAGAVDAIGLANQGESCMAWDAISGEPLSPIIVWQDNRTSNAIEQIRTPDVERMVKQRAGVALDPYFSASKLSWLLQHNPEVRKAQQQGRLHLGTTDTFFIEQLTGVYATDVTTASRTSLMNLHSGQWDEDLCRLFQVPRQLLPEIKPTTADFGLIEGIPLSASVVDQQASLYGHGCRTKGDAKITFGTGAFALAVSDDNLVDSGSPLSTTVAWQTHERLCYALEGGVYDASAAVEWAKSLGLFSDYDELAHFSAASAISRSLAFVPALSGLACPHWDRSANAMWIGMDGGTNRRDLCQAVLEGVALRSAEVIDEMNRHIPIGEKITVDGGLARSPYFVQFLADVLQRQIITQHFDEMTALGCAALAAERVGERIHIDHAAAGCFTPSIPYERAQHWKALFASAVSRTKGWQH